MAKAIILDDEQWDTLRKMGLFDDSAIVLIKESVAQEHGITGKEETIEEYSFGGDPDVYLEIVSSDQHTLVQEILDSRDPIEDEVK